MNQDEFTRTWIIRNSLEEIGNYSKGVLTLRALHYRLVSRGMTNTLRHYKRVVAAMTQARWDGLVDFDTFSDHDRDMENSTDWETTILEEQKETGKQQLRAWMNAYRKNRWENQPYYPEVLIEKKALLGIFKTPCWLNGVAMGACKGYPSLTFLNELKGRIQEAQRKEKHAVILYFGDYDPSGEDIPRAIKENLERMGCYNVEIRRVCLMEEQVLDWGLPPAPAKDTDTRTKSWDGLGQVELDAVEPRKMESLINEAIDGLFDTDLHEELKEQEQKEREEYQAEMRRYVNEEL